MTEQLRTKRTVSITFSSSNLHTYILTCEIHRDNQVQKFLRLDICRPLPPQKKQCCNNDSMPPGLLKWSTQHCPWGGGGK